MNSAFDKATSLTEGIIGAAIEVHRTMGPGLLESIYTWCLARELELRGLACATEQKVTVEYKGVRREEVLRNDLLVEKCVLVEVKAVQEVLPIHKAQLLSYMKLLNVPVGLLINFHLRRLTDGVSRLILPGSGTVSNAQGGSERRKRPSLNRRQRR